MIKVTGYAYLKVPYSIEVNMSVEEFDDLHSKQQDDLIEQKVDWHDACRNAETDYIEVHTIDTVTDKESA